MTAMAETPLPPPLTVESGDAVYTLSPVKTAVVGRGPEADIRVNDPRVAPAHVRVEPHLDRWRALDNDSRTGTYLDGKRCTVVDIGIKRGNATTIHLGHPDGSAVTFRLADRQPTEDFDQNFDPGIARAGAAVAARRRELQITQRTLAKFKIMNAGALIAFEKGRSWPREKTRATLEEVLQWPAGTIADIRSGGAVPGTQPEPTPQNDQVQLVVDAAQVAMKTFTAAIDALPDPSDPEFAERAAVILGDVRQLEAVVTRAAKQSRLLPAVVKALSAVRNTYAELMCRAAASPNATLGQKLFAARRRANLTAAETANAVGLSTALIEAVEAGQQPSEQDAEAIAALLTQLN